MNIINLIIKKLIKNKKKISQRELLFLCKKSKNIFLRQDILLYLNSPIKVCGDIHGQYRDLTRFFYFGGFPPKVSYLFLGDYIDRGRESIETLCLLLAFKIKFPTNFFILRGNHESSTINRIYGFYEECKKKYTIKLWKIFCAVFNCLPLVAIIEKEIFCVHGGLSPMLVSLNQIKEIQRPIEIPENGLICDLLWSDPDTHTIGWVKNDRGISFIFGKDVLEKFTKNFKINLLCRAHQLTEKGFHFFNKRELVTIFSAPNYCGEFKNFGAILNVNKRFVCNFHILKPFFLKKLNYIQLAKSF